MGELINFTAHGLVADDTIMLGNLVGGEGLEDNHAYYVLADGLTANAFKVSETSGGAAIVYTTDITDGVIVGTDVYEVVDNAVMAPPDPVPTPSLPTLTSAEVSGIVRFRITLNSLPEEKVRSWEVQVTHKFVDDSPDWVTPQVFTLPEGSTELSLPALGSTVYAVRIRAQDVYGNFSAYTADLTLTSAAGSDALSASIALLANDVQDGIITETKIAPGSISTPLLQTGAVTADILAATIVLSSLIKTADTGRRIELDIDGIRLFDDIEGLLVRIPTNGDPVYVHGQVNADSLISETSAAFRTAASLESSSVMTLQTGVSTPTIVPALTASVDYLPLTSTPADILTAAGIGYDSAAGTFWLAADPTKSGGYIAHEYNATTGVKVRSLSSTGSISTTTTTLGGTSHVSDTADGFDGSNDSHVATPLTMPRAGRITKVSAYFAGRLGSCKARVHIWSDVSGNGVSEASSDEFTASSGGATGPGNSDQYNKTLSTPYEASNGETVYAGFRHTDAAEGFQFDKNDGAGKDTYRGDGTGGDGTGWALKDTNGKPNVYITYEYDVDTRLETAPNIGIATDGTYLYMLDTLGVIWKYNRTAPSAYVAKSAVLTAITGTKSKAGLFYDATFGELVVTTTTGTGAGVFPKFVRVNTSTLVAGTTYSAAAGTSFSGTTDTFRGGGRVADALGAAATYWVATTSAVYAYTFAVSTATQVANRNFGLAASSGDGLTHDGTQFRGWDSATPTKVWKFSAWDWTTASALYWVGYSWFDSNATGGQHETAAGPRASITLRRRERLQVTNAAIPTGGTDEPDKVRIYMKPGAADWAAGAGWMQVSDALTARFLLDYASSGTADGSVAVFAAGVPAELKSATTGWTLYGDGNMKLGGRTNKVSGLAPIQRVITATGTWTKPAGLSHIVVEVQGAGGGGGGVALTGAAPNAAVGAGGGGGGYARKLFTAADLASMASATVTLGAGGAGGTAGANTGSTGGVTTFAGTGITTVSAGGGLGGEGGTASGTTNQIVSGGFGGACSGGDININGSDGWMGVRGSGDISMVGMGAGAFLGGTKASNGTDAGEVGTAARGYGGGGTGAYNSASQAARAGGAGSIGIVLITEYYL